MRKLLNILAETVFLVGLVVAGSLFSFGQRGNTETIDATAFGTGTQMGKTFGVKLIIYDFSDPEDRDVLVKAFHEGQNDGLVNALEKMKSVGRITIPGTVGYDLTYIREILTPGGRTIRFITNRKIAFGENYWSSESKSFNLSAGEIKLNDQDKSKSEGVLYPAAQLVINNEGEVQFDLRENPWRLVNVIEWK